MKFLLRRVALGLFFLSLVSLSFASAYNGRPKLIVIIVIDQFRGDYLERYRDQFGQGGFRLFLDHGANFTDCNYNYANTRTAPGASPHNLLVDTLGDELKLATQGKARVFGIALKDRAAIFSAGFSGDGAYWVDSKTG